MTALAPDCQRPFDSPGIRQRCRTDYLVVAAAALVGAQISSRGLFDISPSDFLILAAAIGRRGRLWLPPKAVVLSSLVLIAAFSIGLRDALSQNSGTHSFEWALTRTAGVVVVVSYLATFYDLARRLGTHIVASSLAIGVAVTNLLLLVPITAPLATKLLMRHLT